MGIKNFIAMTKELNLIEKQKESLLFHGVEKLKIMGFTNVTKNNILTDEVYQLYFLNFLNKIHNPKNDDDYIAIKELKSHITKQFKHKKTIK